MFFNKKETVSVRRNGAAAARRAAVEPTLSPRFARLVRVARDGAVHVHARRPGVVDVGHWCADREQGRRRRRVALGSVVLSVRLLSLVVGRCRRGARRRRLPADRASRASARASASPGYPGLRACAPVERGARGLALLSTPRRAAAAL